MYTCSLIKGSNTQAITHVIAMIPLELPPGGAGFHSRVFQTSSRTCALVWVIRKAPISCAFSGMLLANLAAAAVSYEKNLRRTSVPPPGGGTSSETTTTIYSAKFTGCQRVEPAGHETTSEPSVLLGVDGVCVGCRRPAVQRHSSAGPHGHRGEKMPNTMVYINITTLRPIFDVQCSATERDGFRYQMARTRTASYRRHRFQHRPFRH